MNDRKNKREPVDEACFAQLMGQALRSMGETAETEKRRLRSDPSAAVPQDLHNENVQWIKSQLSGSCGPANRFKRRTFRHVAIAAAILMILLIPAMAATGPSLSSAWDTIRAFTTGTTAENYPQTQKVNQEGPLYIHWLPKGFWLLEKTQEDGVTTYRYRNSQNNTLEIQLFRGLDDSIYVNTDGASVEEITAEGRTFRQIKKGDWTATLETMELGGGRTVRVFQHDSQTELRWAYERRDCTVVLRADGIPLEDLRIVLAGITFRNS